MTTPWTAMGEPVHMIDEDVFVVTYPERISESTCRVIGEAWQQVMGENKRLIILDSGATITRLSAALTAETTPIYDGLASEFGWSS